MTTFRRLLAPLVIVAAAVIAAFCLAVRATGNWGGAGWSTQSVYDDASFLLVAGLALGGVLVAGADNAIGRTVGATFGLVGAVSLAGTGVVAHRRWLTAGGMSSPAKNLDNLRLLAVVLAGCAILAAVVSLLVVARARVLVANPVAMIVAVAVVMCLPLLLGVAAGSGRSTATGAHLAVYGVAWGIAVALVGSGPRPVAWAATSVVVAHATLLATDATPIIPAPNRLLGVAFAVVAVLIAWVTRRQRRVTLPDRPGPMTN